MLKILMRGKLMEKDRACFRIEYPLADQPLFRQKNEIYPVINLAEGGILFKKDHQDFSNGDKIKGTIIFHDKGSLDIQGKVVRQEKNKVALQLSKVISLQRVMTEQRFLIQKYGTLKQPNEPKPEI